MNYSRAFTYVFEDKNWLSKILIAGLIGLIPIIGQLYLMGWTIEIVRRVKAGRADILPTTHFSYFLTLGLKLFVVCLIYSIPVLILSALMQLFTTSGVNSDSTFAGIFLGGLGCISGLITLVVNIAIALLGTYGMIKLAETDQIKACLDFQDAFNCIKNNLSTFIIVGLLTIVAGLIQAAGTIICIGIIFTVPYGMAISGSLVGQLWDNLKPYKKDERIFRGSVNEPKKESDIIEEAPFTKVEDIEKEAKAAAEDIEDVKEDIIETFEEKTAEIAEDVIEDTANAAEDAAEEITDEVKAKIKDNAPEEDKPADDNSDDLPSFE